SGRRRHTRFSRDWSSDVCSSDLRSHEKRVELAKQNGRSMVRERDVTGASLRLAARFADGGVLHQNKGAITKTIAQCQALLVGVQIGRASCRERGWISGVGVAGDK